jgi:hypothetical protein
MSQMSNTQSLYSNVPTHSITTTANYLSARPLSQNPLTQFIPSNPTEYSIDCRRTSIYYGDDYMFFSTYPKKDPIEDNYVTTQLIWNQKAHHPPPSAKYISWTDVHPGIYRPQNYDGNKPYYTNLTRMTI